MRNTHFSESSVRVGLSVYGYNELPCVFDNIILKPVLALYATKISTRILQQGQRIGYGGDFIVKETMSVSTYDIGYGDGLHRYQEIPFITATGLAILGRISMDFISLASNQETVCIIDNAQEVAKQWNTISYEVLTSLHPDIPRRII
ncbi:MAG: alanine racemase C-terminal domain-containing protein [Sulfurovum sp.]|nr:alanine racemase C-terminal domain-containing protein [Sulfurovum sp.]